MKTLYETPDKQIFVTFDEAHEHECHLFDLWSKRSVTPAQLLEKAAKLTGTFSGSAEEVLYEVFSELHAV